MLFCRITIEKISKKLEKLLFKIIFPMYNSKVCTKQTLIYFQNLLKDYLAQDAVFKTNAGTTTFNVFGAKAAKAGTTLQAKVNTTTGSITVEFTDGTNVIDGKSIKYSVTR